MAFVGEEVAANSSDQATVQVFAVTTPRTHAVLVANLSDSPQEVKVSFKGWKPGPMQRYEISAGGFSGPEHMEWSSARKTGVTLQPKSVTVLAAR